MNQKHKQAFQELRQWCEKWDAEFWTDYDDRDIDVYVRAGGDITMESFRAFIDKTTFNLMEQEENDNTEK